jgi:enoyl-CoA hydratase/carnithine racemase
MSFIRSRLEGEILFITFQDSSSRNSWSLGASRELREVLRARDPRVRALVFSAEGRVFCSGGNLSDYAALSKAEEGRAINDEITSDLAALASLGVPTVCSIGGDCFGGGVELASAFDVVLAAPHVMFGLWQKKIGLSYGWGGGARIERRIGSARLREWSLTSRCVLASEARAAGLIDEVVAADSLAARTVDVAKRLASGSMAATVALKNFDSKQERETFHSLWWTDDHRAALQSRKRS